MKELQHLQLLDMDMIRFDFSTLRNYGEDSQTKLLFRLKYTVELNYVLDSLPCIILTLNS